jgi:hypothetical protein
MSLSGAMLPDHFSKYPSLDQFHHDRQAGLNLSNVQDRDDVWGGSAPTLLAPGG